MISNNCSKSYWDKQLVDSLEDVMVVSSVDLLVELLALMKAVLMVGTMVLTLV